jgi:hypothetical protein
MKYTVYVNSLYGSDSNAGDIDTPVKSLTYADSIVYEGGTIVLQTGSGSYGNYTITKNVSVKAAFGAAPIVGVFTVNNAQVLFEGLRFQNTPTAVVINNQSIGSIQILGCVFSNVSLAVDIQNVQYISIHRCNFKDHSTGIRIQAALEACISSNIFDSGSRAIEVTTVDRLDIWKNTIYGAASTGGGGGTPNQNLRVIYYTLNSFDISYKRVQLPSAAFQNNLGKYEVAINSINGSSFAYDTDFTVIGGGTLISWDGLALVSQVNVGDVIRVMYSEGASTGGGEALRIQNIGSQNSRIDSNNIGKILTDVAIGVYFNTSVKIRHNNFFGVTTPWQGALPYGSTGSNFVTGMDPQYRDPLNSDFHLSATSPDRDAADPGRWSEIYGEMGVIKVAGHFTASVTGIRTNVAPFERDLDYDLYARSVTGMFGVSGDIGALTYNRHETARGHYVSEQGYDISNPGTATGPYATVDRGFVGAGSSGLNVATNLVPYQIGVTGPYTESSSGSAYGRYYSKNMVVGNSTLIVGQHTPNDVLYVYPSSPSYETGAVYVGPDTGVGVTGTAANPYRTITDAMSFGGTTQILVRPGIYPTFVGITGMKIIGAAESKTIPIGSNLFTNFNNSSWTGSGSYTKTASDVVLVNSSDITGKFTFEPSIDFKATATVTNMRATIGISNGADSLYVILDRAYQKSIIGYTTGGVTYEIEEAITGSILAALTKVKLKFTVVNGKFSVTINNGYINRSYGGMLEPTYTSPWYFKFSSHLSGITEITDVYLTSSTFQGATGIVNYFNTRRKVFAISGVTGTQR